MQQPQPLSFSHPLTVAQIERLRSCDPDTRIRLWTTQHPEAVAQLDREGQLVSDPNFAFAPNGFGNGDSGYFRQAYDWMIEQMDQRLPPENGLNGLPVWAHAVRPSPVAGSTLLELEVPRHRVLFSFYTPWELLLGVFSDIHHSSGNWPSTAWLTAPYLIANDADNTRHREAAFKVPSEAECRETWAKIFDLSLAATPGFRWGQGLVLQAVLRRIYRSDVCGRF